MSKKKTNKLTGICIIILFISVTGFIFFNETQDKEVVPDYMIGHPYYDKLKIEQRIQGRILPEDEIKVKSKINGIIDSVFVEVGQRVTFGQKIAVIRNLSEPMDIENLKSAVNIYEIQLQTAQLNFEREKKLTEAGLSPAVELERSRAEYNQLKEQLTSANKKLQMATSGMFSTDRELTNIIYAPAQGTVLKLYAKTGTPVIKQNNFSEGTTIAIIADMNRLKYYGKIPESFISEIYEGQEISIETLLNRESEIRGRIEKIYPMGNDEEGIVMFPIEASLYQIKNKLWGGINAIAIIKTWERDSVLCIDEKYLIYEKDSCYAYILKGDGKYSKTAIMVGLTDGLKTEIISGISINDNIKLAESQAQ